MKERTKKETIRKGVRKHGDRQRDTRKPLPSHADVNIYFMLKMKLYNRIPG